MKFGIIIQARMGSKRFPGKILTKIYKDNTLLDVIIKNLKKLDQKIIIATTNKDIDKEVVKLAKNHDLSYFCGEEENVLKRFIDCATKFKIKNIIRVCADNCFIQNEFLSNYFNESNLEYDYIAYKVGNLNGILTHWGLFGELVTLKTLKKVEKLTTKKDDLEHVTYYIYTHPTDFRIKYLNVPDVLIREDIRLTIDTPEDLRLCKTIIKILENNNLEWNYKNILSILEKNKYFFNIMKENIKKNKKV